MIATINPANNETLRVFDAISATELDERLERAWAAFLMYRRTSIAERARWMVRAAEILEREKLEFGRLMTLEMGKPLKAAVEEALKCALGCRYYAENAARILADEALTDGAPTDGVKSDGFVRYQPVGPVLAVMPWNFPMWQVLRFLAPALMAGNVGLLKHASNVPQCALAIEELVRRAGFPADVFQTLLMGSDLVARAIDSPRVRAVTLTGSELAGRKVASQAAGQIKKSVLELGGSDAFVVMRSADLDRAVATGVQARMVNNGQSCIAAKRFIVDAPIAGEFERRFAAAMEQVRVGDPMEEDTQLGPLATAAILDELHGQVRRSVEMGARVVMGGYRLERPGNYYAPTVLADIPAGAPAYREELFGPVASLFRADGFDDALRIANDTDFGLGACIWTSDAAERERFIGEMESGQVFVNGMVASDPRRPFGGVKNSGYGRELGAEGMREFLNAKTVVIKG